MKQCTNVLCQLAEPNRLRLPLWNCSGKTLSDFKRSRPLGLDGIPQMSPLSPLSQISNGPLTKVIDLSLRSITARRPANVGNPYSDSEGEMLVEHFSTTVVDMPCGKR